MNTDEANAPHLDWHLEKGERGREVWYSLVTDADGDTAFWYRYTLVSTERGHQEARLWAGLTGTDDDLFGTRRYPLTDAVFDEPFALSFGGEGDARLTSSSANGALEVDGTEVSWMFEYEPDDTVFTPLRSEKVTKMAEEYLGSGRHWSANQSVRMDGTLEVGGETYEFADAPGHQGHTVGKSAPEEWSWLHCNSFEDGTAAENDARDACVEVLNIGGMTTVCFRRGGEAHMLNRMKNIVGPTANETTTNRPGKWKIHAKGEGVKLDVWVDCDEETRWKKAAYLAPDDTSRYVAHSSLSSVQVTYRVKEDDGWSEQRTLDSEAARAEWGSTSPPVGEKDEYKPEEFA